MYKQTEMQFGKGKGYYHTTHYSVPGHIMYFLIRMMPFSKLAAELQSGKFDCADRLFRSVGHAYNCAVEIDGKELVPQFYSLPEAFLNLNCFNFGELSQDDHGFSGSKRRKRSVGLADNTVDDV